MGDDISEAGTRFINIDVDYDCLSALFWDTPQVKGEIRGASS